MDKIGTNTCYVYRIKNLLEEKSYYIGITTRSPKIRWREHIAASKSDFKGFKSDIHIEMEKLGIENFDFQIIEELSSISFLLERENSWVRSLKKLGCKVYNRDFYYIASNITDEVRLKISKTLKEKVKRKITRCQAEIIRYYLEIGFDVNYLADYYKVHNSTISNIKLRKTHKDSIKRETEQSRRVNITEIEKKEIFDLWIEDNMSNIEISNKYKIDQSCIGKIVNSKLGVGINGKDLKFRIKRNKIQNLLKENKTIKEIALILGYSDSSQVSRIIRDYNLNIYNNSKYTNHKNRKVIHALSK